MVRSTPAPASPIRSDQRNASPHPVALERDRRRLRVVDPEAEPEAAGACVRGTVEDDVVGARTRPYGAGCEHGRTELGQVGVEVDGQGCVPGEAVLVARGDDARLDQGCAVAADDHDPEIRNRPRQREPEDLLGALQHGRDGAAGRHVRIPVARGQRGPAARIPAVQPRCAKRDGGRGRESGPGDAKPERHAPDICAACQSHEPRQVALDCGWGDNRGEVERTRSRDGERSDEAGTGGGRDGVDRDAPGTGAAPCIGQVDAGRHCDAGTDEPEGDGGRLRQNERDVGLERVRETAAASRRGSDLAAAVDVAAGSDQRGLEHCDGPGRMTFDQQRSGTGDLRACHRRARHRLPAAVRDRREDRDAGRADVGLQPEREWCRAGGAEVGKAARGAARARDGCDRDRLLRRAR